MREPDQCPTWMRLYERADCSTASATLLALWCLSLQCADGTVAGEKTDVTPEAQTGQRGSSAIRRRAWPSVSRSRWPLALIGTALMDKGSREEPPFASISAKEGPGTSPLIYHLHRPSTDPLTASIGGGLTAPVIMATASDIEHCDGWITAILRPNR